MIRKADRIIRFQETIRIHYSRHARTFPWRETTDPYEIFISEIMLQQTQVERVSGKYRRFLEEFPDFESLAGADLQTVLQAWQGLGYNRRAVNLREAARRISEDHQGILPQDMDALLSLPGVGPSTAGAVLSFAYSIPAVFIETNIRRVFIHFFFTGRDEVRDSEILPLVEETLDRDNPSQWYYALMDYGAMLKDTLPNPNRKSAHYARQARFEGSSRQARGKILKELLSRGPLSSRELTRMISGEPERTGRVLEDLVREGFIRQQGLMISIA